MSGRDVAAANRQAAGVLVGTLTRAGLRHVVVSPGSRSTPLALAAAHDERAVLHVVLDERSAGFFALGLAKAHGVASALICTSGTATANYLPAVVEAHHARVPLLVVTADRPPELRGVGAPQTIDQSHLYGVATRLFVDLDPPGDGAPDALVDVARRCWEAAHGDPAGPVHCNSPFREPLVGPSAPVLGAALGAPLAASSASVPDPPAAAWTDTGGDEAGIARLAELARDVERGLVVAGWGSGVRSDVLETFCAAAGWPLLADPISGLRSSASVRCYDALARDERFADAHAPQVVVRLGGPPTSKALAAWLARDPEVHQLLVARPGPVLDPDRVVTDTVLGDPVAVLRAATRTQRGPASTWIESWRRADRVASTVLDDALDAGICPEGRLARDVVAAAPSEAVLGVASSMPVRDVEAFAPARTDLTFIANRGANGIDGFTSTVLGAATAADRPAVALLGDLCFLHDTNGLLAATAPAHPVTFVVVDNDGGGIFEFLPQATHVERAEFERLFATPQGVDVVEIARAHGVEARRCEPEEVARSLRTVSERRGAEVLVVASDRRRNVDGHRRLQAIVSEALARDADGAGR